MSDDSRTAQASPAEMRFIDGVCDQFERAWQAGEPALEEFLSRAPGEYRGRLLKELAAIELLYRCGPAGERVTVDEFVALHPALGDELRSCAAELADIIGRGATKRLGADGRPATAASDVRLASFHQPQGLHIRCPHCASPVELLADTPEEDVTCRACGSTFCLVDRADAGPSAPALQSMGRFELISRLGVGGFGTVWKARDPELDRIVALKIPRRGQLAADEVEFFFREARAAAQLRHPHIVAVYEIGREGDTVFIVSDFVRGTTLSEWMQAQRPSVREAAQLCAVVAEALDHAHSRGVVHRDLKPSNIMIDDQGQPRLMDFGLAKRESGEVTMTCEGQILGTAAYMSPEQAAGRGHWIDRRADVYSLGVVMYQMAAGELPYRGNFEVQLASKLRDDAPDPRRLNRHIPRDFATICLKCLERDPNRRYGGAGAVAAELRRFLAGEPIHARPLSRAARVARWARRKPALAAAATLAAILAVAGPIAALVIDSQRRQLDGRVRELDALVRGQEDATRKLRDENADLQRSLKSLVEAEPGAEVGVLQWRRELIAEIVRRHYDAAAEDDNSASDAESRAQRQLAWGMLLAAADRSEEATAEFAAARALLEQLTGERPQDAHVAAALAECCEQLAELYGAAGDDAAARAAAQRAIDVRTALAAVFQGAAAPQIDLLAAHTLFPQPRDSMAALAELSERILADWPHDAAALYEAACRLTFRAAVLSAPPSDPD